MEANVKRGKTEKSIAALDDTRGRHRRILSLPPLSLGFSRTPTNRFTFCFSSPSYWLKIGLYSVHAVTTPSSVDENSHGKVGCHATA